MGVGVGLGVDVSVRVRVSPRAGANITHPFTNTYDSGWLATTPLWGGGGAVMVLSQRSRMDPRDRM